MPVLETILPSNRPTLSSRFLPTGPSLVYSARFTTAPFPGGTTRWWNTFADFGTDPERVTNVTLDGGLGSFKLPGTPFYLTTGTIRIANMTIAIPTTVVPGNYSLTVRVYWQYQTPANATWYDSQPVIDYDWVIVQGSPSTSQGTPPPPSGSSNSPIPGLGRSGLWDRLIDLEGRLALPAIAGFWILAFAGTIIVARRRTGISHVRVLRFCPHCGTQLQARNTNCPRCGTNLAAWNN